MLLIYPGHSLHADLFAIQKQVEDKFAAFGPLEQQLSHLQKQLHAHLITGAEFIRRAAAHWREVDQLRQEAEQLRQLPGGAYLQGQGVSLPVLYVENAHSADWQAAVAEAKVLKEAAFARSQARKLHALCSLGTRARLQKSLSA